ncbi:MAG: Fic family protein [Proteobacteria bacterium]|nr:Fic family protein [Pseudomonadota bacterium]
MWAWEHPNWPKFVIDEGAFTGRIEAFHRTAERLFGNVEVLGDEGRTDTEIELMLSEAIATSAIEGENLDRDSVRSSLLAHFGKVVARTETTADMKAAGAASLIVDTRRKWDRPLTHELLGAWQTMAIPEARSSLVLRGAYREREVEIVGGYEGRHEVYYVAPPASRVTGEMERFLEWYNAYSIGMAGPIRASIAHLWFERIHPFDDGNGRVGRAIADHALSQALNRPTLACLATAIGETRKDYYEAFEGFDRSERLEMNGFTDYFTSAVVRAQEIARAEVRFILDKSRFFDRYRNAMNERQTRAMERMFREGRRSFAGGMSAKKYRAITKCPPATATRDLSALAAMGALISKGGGRSTRYEIVPSRW